MTQKITVADVEKAFDGYIAALSALGVPTGHLYVYKTGTGFLVGTTDPAQLPPVFDLVSNIGRTAGEAVSTLDAAAGGLKFAGQWTVSNPARVLR